VLKNNSEEQKTFDEKETITKIEECFKEYSILGSITETIMTPFNQNYIFTIDNIKKANEVKTVKNNLQAELCAKNITVERYPKKANSFIISVENEHKKIVGLKEFVKEKRNENKLHIPLGKSTLIKNEYLDLEKEPFLLINGQDSSGKTMFLNSTIIYLLMNYKPSELKLLLIDPKKVELINYNGVAHLLCPVISKPKEASYALQKIVLEMENRYEIFNEAKVKNINDYNEYLKKENPNLPKLPHTVIIIDELSDLMITTANEVEDAIIRIAQKARNTGIHLIIATKRASSDIITSDIKINIRTRIAFKTTSAIDSRVILGDIGAENLTSKGDMLYLPMSENTPTRIQGCYVSEEEISKVVEHIYKEQKPEYDESLAKQNIESHDIEEYDDPLYNEIVEFCLEMGKVSASTLQRKYRLGYNQAARLIELLEERGIIGPNTGSSKPREVIIKR